MPTPPWPISARRGRILGGMAQHSAREPRYSAGSPFKARPVPEIEEFAVGDRVTHDKFGLGRVIKEGSGAVVVDFGAERARIASPFTRLTKL